MFDDTYFMKIALKEAEKALDKGEIPIGAIVVTNDMIIAKAHNLTEQLKDVTAHAEIQAITSASEYLGGKYLKECTMYITLEPCAMCAGALYWSQIGKVVFGAADKQRGFQSFGGKLHPKTELITGVLEKECSVLLQNFFQSKRE
ncbi:MAG: nucleoside deaminase [Capnocytophaga sp.]|nr:nucleoside deaminase [Capnocytophaga sp.]